MMAESNAAKAKTIRNKFGGARVIANGKLR